MKLPSHNFTCPICGHAVRANERLQFVMHKYCGKDCYGSLQPVQGLTMFQPQPKRKERTLQWEPVGNPLGGLDG